MPKLRPYRLDDIPKITSQVKKYLPELPHYRNIEVAEDRISYLMTHNYGNAAYFQSWVLEANDGDIVGGIAGYCVQGMVTWSLIANDIFLYIREDHRSLRNVRLLIGAYKRWAIARGAVLICATTTAGYKQEQFGILMKREGFMRIGDLYHLRTDDTFLVEQLEALKG